MASSTSLKCPDEHGMNTADEESDTQETGGTKTVEENQRPKLRVFQEKLKKLDVIFPQRGARRVAGQEVSSGHLGRPGIGLFCVDLSPWDFSNLTVAPIPTEIENWNSAKANSFKKGEGETAIACTRGRFPMVMLELEVDCLCTGGTPCIEGCQLRILPVQFWE
ncbi:hypothetical protein Bbelb_322540 [Branchiostoma belcheri]|nr:hypothetical protein Bbelb_322540 [Branchiostoma belcheri]